MPTDCREASNTEVLGDVELLIPTRRTDCVTMSYGRHRRQPHPQLTIRTSSAPAAWSKCPLVAPELGSCGASGCAWRLWAVPSLLGRGRTTGLPASPRASHLQHRRFRYLLTVQAPITTEAVDALLEYGQLVLDCVENKLPDLGQLAPRRLLLAPEYARGRPSSGQPRPTRCLGHAVPRCPGLDSIWLSAGPRGAVQFPLANPNPSPNANQVLDRGEQYSCLWDLRASRIAPELLLFARMAGPLRPLGRWSSENRPTLEANLRCVAVLTGSSSIRSLAGVVMRLTLPPRLAPPLPLLPPPPPPRA